MARPHEHPLQRGPQRGASVPSRTRSPAAVSTVTARPAPAGDQPTPGASSQRPKKQRPRRAGARAARTATRRRAARRSPRRVSRATSRSEAGPTAGVDGEGSTTLRRRTVCQGDGHDACAVRHEGVEAGVELAGTSTSPGSHRRPGRGRPGAAGRGTMIAGQRDEGSSRRSRRAAGSPGRASACTASRRPLCDDWSGWACELGEGPDQPGEVVARAPPPGRVGERRLGGDQEGRPVGDVGGWATDLAVGFGGQVHAGRAARSRMPASADPPWSAAVTCVVAARRRP